MIGECKYAYTNGCLKEYSALKHIIYDYDVLSDSGANLLINAVFLLF